MAWKRIVRRLGHLVCPKCSNQGFNLLPKDDPLEESEKDLVQCTRCGHICREEEWRLVSD